MAMEQAYLQAQPRQRSWLFWTLSLTAHGCVVVLLLYTPAKQFILSRPKPEKRAPMRIRGKELEEFVDELRDQTCEELRARVDLLEAGQTRMADNFQTMNEHLFKDFLEMQRNTARERLETYLGQALARSSALKAICDQGLAAKRSAEMVQAYAGQTSQILAALEEVGRGLRLIKALNPLVPLQAEALKTQYTALQFHRYHEEALLTRSRYLERLPQQRVELDKLNATLREAGKLSAGKRKELTTRIKERAAVWKEDRRVRAELGKAEAALRQVLKAKNRQGEAGARKRVADCRQRRQEAGRRGHQLDKRMGELKREIRKLEQAAARDRDRGKRLQQDIAKRQGALPELEKRRLSMLKVARNVQSGVYWKVKSIADQVHAYFEQGTLPRPPAKDGKADDGKAKKGKRRGGHRQPDKAPTQRSEGEAF